MKRTQSNKGLQISQRHSTYQPWERATGNPELATGNWSVTVVNGNGFREVPKGCATTATTILLLLLQTGKVCITNLIMNYEIWALGELCFPPGTALWVWPN